MKKINTSCIIDDDDIFIYGTKRIIKEVNFCEEILVFNNGQDALDEFKKLTDLGKELPSIIFLDLNMPIMNGWEFLEQFTKIENNNQDKVIVYIISSSVDPRDLEKVGNYEIIHNYILKPFSSKDLESILKDVTA
ncbi:response regulator [Aurantibacter crassamenti]|uniref:response regulator n=1 Tax=Aurantibacter crassamenti TaxID=1837375 RepID=UPI0019398FA2|nr:response regulator [Aurantibacter crassamenti]MBM1104889.1 response regulator [Aurantibacter crassamenti]